jgi:hypothetical protein
MGRAGMNDEPIISETERFAAAEQLAEQQSVAEEFAALIAFCEEKELGLSIVAYTDGRIYVNVNPLDGDPADETESVFVMYDPYPAAEAFRIALDGAKAWFADGEAWASGDDL